MGAVVVFKSETGKLEGLGAKGQRAYGRFLAAIKALAVGEMLQFEWRAPRSPKFHRLFFATLNRLFEMQEQFADVDHLRSWLTVGAGYCTFVPGPKGRMVALPQSMSWAVMDDNEFREFVTAMDAFLFTEHAQRFLWPHLSAVQTNDAIETLMLEYRR